MNSVLDLGLPLPLSLRWGEGSVYQKSLSVCHGSGGPCRVGKATTGGQGKGSCFTDCCLGSLNPLHPCGRQPQGPLVPNPVQQGILPFPKVPFGSKGLGNLRWNRTSSLSSDQQMVLGPGIGVRIPLALRYWQILGKERN